MAVLGDVSVYSTYCYLMDLLKDEFPCVMVPGVPAFCAVAAKVPVRRWTCPEPRY